MAYQKCGIRGCGKLGQWLQRLPDGGFGLVCPTHDNMLGLRHLQEREDITPEQASIINRDIIRAAPAPSTRPRAPYRERPCTVTIAGKPEAVLTW